MPRAERHAEYDDDPYGPDGPSAEDVERFGDDSVLCPVCGNEAYDDLPLCPHCGHALLDDDLGRPTPKVATIVTIFVIGAFIVATTLWMIL